PFGEGRYGMYSLLMVPASPEEEELVVRGDLDRLQNQLYLQRGSELVTEGGVTLGEPYVLWAKVAGRGVFLLYDRGHLILNQGYVTPGWYRISGAYADFLGVHIYRFVSGSLQSNNLSVVAASGGYPTGFSLTGRVVDPGGQGIPGARVTASNSEGGRFSTATDASGYYALDLPTGTYLVNAERYGYAFYPTTAQVWTGLVAAARPIVGYPAGQPSPDS
ncbi:MAG: carboxypeptidase-like regulatory domain-containing protein, partial [Methanothrix sp.]|nr:carboxypeptidase-like regulatory domain-containing protein [Methanothrix sp.]